MSFLVTHISVPDSGTTVAATSSADWSKLGFEGNPVPGDPQVLQGIVDDFTFLRDTAWSVWQGLDAFVAAASSGGFEGAAADAVREVVSGRLKAFIHNIARAFSLAGETVAEYRNTLVQVQQASVDAFNRTDGVAAKDAKLAVLKSQVQGQVGQVSDAARVLEAALRDAAQLVAQPIKVPSLWDRIHRKLELALGIVAGVLALLSVPFDGPVGLALAAAAFTAGTTVFAMTAVDYARHQASWSELLLASLGFLMPGGRGIFGMAALGAGARAVVDGAAHAWGVVRSPAALAGLMAKAVPAAARGVADAAAAAGRGLVLLPGAVWRGAVALPSVLRAAPGFVRDVGRGASGVVAEDFAGMAKRYPRLAGTAQGLGFAGKTGMYLGVTSLRTAAALFTPLRFSEMADLGFRGAWAEFRAVADWSKGLADFRMGYAAYARLGQVGKGLAAGGLHELGLAGSHAGDAGLHEPKVAPALAGMPLKEMRNALEKMPQTEFRALIGETNGILRPVMPLMPVVGRDATAQALRVKVFDPVVAVANTLREHGEDAAKALAAQIGKESPAPLWHGLAGGAPVAKVVPGETLGQPLLKGLKGESSGTKLWVPGTPGHGELPGLEERGAQAGAGEHAPVAPTEPGPSSLLRQHLDQTALETGAVPTTSGLLVPIQSVFTPQALQTLERIGREGLSPESAEQLFKQVPGEGHLPGSSTVLPEHAANPHQTLEPLRPEQFSRPEAIHGAEPRTLFEALGGPQGPEHLLTSVRALDSAAGRTVEPGHALAGAELPSRIDMTLQHISQPYTAVTVGEHLSPSAFARKGAVREALPLHGVPGLEGARIQRAAVDWVPHLEVVDAHGRVLADRVVTLRETGGFTVSGGPPGAVHYFSRDQAFEFRTVLLPGTPWRLRFETAAGLGGPVRVVRLDGTPVRWNRHGVDVVRDAPDRLTVRVRMPDANGAGRTATWSLTPDGMVRQVRPGEIGEPASLEARAFEHLQGGSLSHVPGESAGRFERVVGESSRVMPGGSAGEAPGVVRAEQRVASTGSRAVQTEPGFAAVPAKVAELRAAADQELLRDIPAADRFEPASVRRSGDRALPERLAGGGPGDPLPVDPRRGDLVNRWRTPMSSEELQAAWERSLAGRSDVNGEPRDFPPSLPSMPDLGHDAAPPPPSSSSVQSVEDESYYDGPRGWIDGPSRAGSVGPRPAASWAGEWIGGPGGWTGMWPISPRGFDVEESAPRSMASSPVSGVSDQHASGGPAGQDTSGESSLVRPGEIGEPASPEPRAFEHRDPGEAQAPAARVASAPPLGWHHVSEPLDHGDRALLERLAGGGADDPGHPVTGELVNHFDDSSWGGFFSALPSYGNEEPYYGQPSAWPSNGYTQEDSAPQDRSMYDNYSSYFAPSYDYRNYYEEPRHRTPSPASSEDEAELRSRWGIPDLEPSTPSGSPQRRQSSSSSGSATSEWSGFYEPSPPRDQERRTSPSGSTASSSTSYEEEEDQNFHYGRPSEREPVFRISEENSSDLAEQASTPRYEASTPRYEASPPRYEASPARYESPERYEVSPSQYESSPGPSSNANGVASPRAMGTSSESSGDSPPPPRGWPPPKRASGWKWIKSRVRRMTH